MTSLSRRTFLAGTALLALGAGARTPLALEKLYPAFASLPRAGLWGAEPAIRHAHALASALGIDGGVHVMRDDQGGTAFGGGKARKLDLILGDAIRSGVTAVATTGGAGSNHARSTVMAARALGLGCTLALLPEAETAEVKRNLDEMRRRGATVTVGDRAAVERARKATEAAGTEARRTMWIPMGGTSPLGNLAFVDAALSLLERTGSGNGGELPVPDAIVTALGSTGSAVGLAVGLAVGKVPTRVVAVRCSSPATSSRAVIDAAVDATVALLRSIEPSIPAAVATDAKARLEVDSGELGGGYGVASARGKRAASTIWDREKIMLEQTYGAKAAAALVRRAAQWKSSHVLLWMGCDERWLAGRAP